MKSSQENENQDLNAFEFILNELQEEFTIICYSIDEASIIE